MPPGRGGDARRAEVAWRRADHAHRTGDWEAQERESRRTLALAERAGDVSLALRAIHRLAPALAFRGDPAAGRALAEAGLERARTLDLPREEVRLLNILTVCTDMLGDRAASLKYTLLELELSRARGYRIYEAVGLSNVGMSYLVFGAFAEARRAPARGAPAESGARQPAGRGKLHSILSELEWREGNHELALSHAEAAQVISLAVASRLHQADSLWSRGNVRLALRSWADAQADFVRSEALARNMDLVPQVLNALDGQARVALARGDRPDARRIAERLLAEAEGRAVAGVPRRQWLSGTYEHLIRLTLHQAFAGADDARAETLLVEAFAVLMDEADRIDDVELRRRFLTNIAENREIVCLWNERPEAGRRENPESHAR